MEQTSEHISEKTRRIKQTHLLEVKNLSVRFQSADSHAAAVDDISFVLKPGETLGIVGESGSGKTVTSLALMGLLSSSTSLKGQLLFDSKVFNDRLNLLEQGASAFRKMRGKDMAMIFQEPMSSLNPVFTCGDQVSEAILAHDNISRKAAKARTLELFEKVHLPRPESIFDSYPHEISGGQKQRVMIAMALSCKPSLLIADEPTTALDVTVQAAILDTIRELREDHETAVVFISHDLSVVAEVADRILVMYQGRIVEQGDVWDIFSNPQHPYTKGLLACRPRLDIKLKVLPVVSDFMHTDEKGRVSEVSDVKFKSVGQALMVNYQSESELREVQTERMKNEPLLEINELKKYFISKKGFFSKKEEVFKAVNDVSFKVYPGETLGLVGESGCGKSTLARTILRLDQATSGEILFEGRDINHLSAKEMRALRRKVQIIFQDPFSSLNPRFTIGEAIMEPMRIHGVMENDRQRRKYVVELLETVNLSEMHFNRYPHEFSGGQRQRICIARSLALKPSFLICDESVSALDVSVQAQVLNLLNRLKDRYNLTYIFISHDLAVVKFISDRILVMNQGQIVEQGFAEDIYRNPQHSYTKSLIQSIPRGDLDSIRKAMLQRKLQRTQPKKQPQNEAEIKAQDPKGESSLAESESSEVDE